MCSYHGVSLFQRLDEIDKITIIKHSTGRVKHKKGVGRWESGMSIGKKDTGTRTDKTAMSQITCQVTRQKPQACFSNRTNALLFLLAALCDTQPHTNMVTFKSFHVYRLPSGLTVGLQVRFSLLRSLYLTRTHINKASFLTEARRRWIKLHGSLLFLSRGRGSSSVPRPKQTYIYHCNVVVIFRALFDIAALCVLPWREWACLFHSGFPYNLKRADR